MSAKKVTRKEQRYCLDWDRLPSKKLIPMFLNTLSLRGCQFYESFALILCYTWFLSTRVLVQWIKHQNVETINIVWFSWKSRVQYKMKSVFEREITTILTLRRRQVLLLYSSSFCTDFSSVATELLYLTGYLITVNNTRI